MCAYILYVLIILVPAAFLALDYFRPGSSAIKAAKEWQTLIGAVVGFIAVSYALTMEHRNTANREKQNRLTTEINILYSASIDIGSTLKSLEALSILTNFNNAQECNNSLKIIYKHPVKHITVKPRMPEIASLLSPQGYAALIREIKAMDLYFSGTRSLNVQDCIMNTGSTKKLLSSTITGTITKLKNVRTKIKSQIEEIKSKLD